MGKTDMSDSNCKLVYLSILYNQGRPSSQCHRAMALVVFYPAPKVRAHIGCLVAKSLEVPRWHWLISSPMGALVYNSNNSCFVGLAKALLLGWLV